MKIAAAIDPQNVNAQAHELSLRLLPMGTVARTGIPGFVIGNTAENILRKLDCAPLAAKPNGFDRPVTVC